MPSRRSARRRRTLCSTPACASARSPARRASSRPHPSTGCSGSSRANRRHAIDTGCRRRYEGRVPSCTLVVPHPTAVTKRTYEASNTKKGDPPAAPDNRAERCTDSRRNCVLRLFALGAAGSPAEPRGRDLVAGRNATPPDPEPALSRFRAANSRDRRGLAARTVSQCPPSLLPRSPR